jgi:hypothetical protein
MPWSALTFWVRSCCRPRLDKALLARCVSCCYCSPELAVVHCCGCPCAPVFPNFPPLPPLLLLLLLLLLMVLPLLWSLQIAFTFSSGFLLDAVRFRMQAVHRDTLQKVIQHWNEQHQSELKKIYLKKMLDETVRVAFTFLNQVLHGLQCFVVPERRLLVRNLCLPSLSCLPAPTSSARRRG